MVISEHARGGGKFDRNERHLRYPRDVIRKVLEKEGCNILGGEWFVVMIYYDFSVNYE